MNDVKGGVCTANEFFQSCSGDTHYVLCSPAASYKDVVVCNTNYVTCGDVNGGQYDTCDSNGENYTSCFYKFKS